ncbi:TetR/AcrR family transcriptional regulator [Cryptosporangium minutisporangium]|uniref:TetR family transcriptional regulator n=1 Tax=Cryptosporangium minutisporangium TaxID=113569 RepID=A0ABP6TCF3_9ACTN
MAAAGPTRDAARTRRTLLDAAARAVLAHGAAVSLEVVAREAGVSKGGLLHHFPSKDALFTGLVDDLLDQFAAAVDAHLDPADDRPGRLARAYVRAIFADLELADSAENTREHATLMAALGHLPQVFARAQEDGRRWKAAFAADGLHPQRSTLVIRAADGTATASLYEGHLEPGELAETREWLLALTRETGPLIP